MLPLIILKQIIIVVGITSQFVLVIFSKRSVALKGLYLFKFMASCVVAEQKNAFLHGFERIYK